MHIRYSNVKFDLEGRGSHFLSSITEAYLTLICLKAKNKLTLFLTSLLGRLLIQSVHSSSVFWFSSQLSMSSKTLSEYSWKVEIIVLTVMINLLLLDCALIIPVP